MAAGRHGGYRGYEVARERELDLEAARRGKEYHHRHRHPSRHSDSDDRRDGGRSRDRELSNGYSRRHSPHLPPKSRPSGRREEREPGEVSSRSGSEESFGRPLKPRETSVNGVPVARREGGAMSPSKKRKHSPVILDRNGSKPRVQDIVKSTKEVDTLVAELPDVSTTASMDLDVSVDIQHDERLQEHGNNRIMEEEEEDGYPITRNIMTSRWADADGEEEIVPKKKKSVSPQQGSTKKVASPELGELVVGSSGGDSVSSDSGVVRGSANGDLEVDKGDCIVEKDAGDDSSVVHMLDIDSESHACRSRILEPARSSRRCINMLQGCRSVDEFERLNTINEGTYGIVSRAKDLKTGETVALKKVKMEKEREGFPLTSLREINILLSFHHPSIVDVQEIVVGSGDSTYMVMEYMEHDLKAVMETMKQPYSQSEVKCLMLQLLEGVKYLHDNWVIHRDLKTSNILLNNRGELKICDFGLSRQYGSPLKPYTQLVVTLWYRAPELLLGAKEYSTAIDMWSLGCIMAELLTKKPLFNGKRDIDQLSKIIQMLGTPNESIWPGYSKLPGARAKFPKQPYNKLREKFPAVSFTGGLTLSEAGFDLLNRMLTYDPETRISADAALNHEWFREVPLPQSRDFMPTFPSLNEQDRRMKKCMRSPDPLEEQRMKEQGSIGDRGIFG
ncbi:cyclin-dependent kinase G-1 [Brachypodium distachyon]|uniref:Protein kinase domain-containing protein n=1 Tax=Brachypodium distachyon TaxID=15368 RepID=I1IBB0_BRADI|nr:cyclin-dependent kinase G-1 [Brachypodium distachyon]XP_024316668.1 cyclin-dependent kinase G-1 [Brachypodium distachyon]XP_024316669.1 cyclin-dependent kinase G-1 [Brachypodium distachyon]XP_024316670.1 cyclin-dependent kinase G-1 [Brachypodium distachyon]XP_024316671.1 cyclin-dependent kinase G-1 [Brachypodium distachyon]XP_024316672.1 cyclin-dependent kinase G-1 [Brachypodium distachyon]XP_024316673.1 cyclin-dependent kinase G-1 [Brachypodium distachyon]XP_024316674.1 cyclin-dependent |eukprot:XP_024316667.1 cyclin-dependent kinase G-1 [Brachypodium distachyon]